MVSKKKAKPPPAAPAPKKRKESTLPTKKTTRSTQTAATTKSKKASHKYQQLTTPRWVDVFEAAANNDTIAVRYYVERDESLVKAVNPDEKTIALIAAENVNLPLLQYVLEKNGSTDVLNFPDIYGKSVLQRAIEKSDLEMVKYLVEDFNWNVTEPNPRSFKNTPIHFAAEEGQLEILKYFIEERKGDPDIRNELGDPPLFLAADKPHLDVVKYLFEECKADIKALNNHGCNILYRSAKRNDLTVPQYLLEEKRVPFDVNWRDIMNCTIVYTATRYARYEFIDYIVTKHKVDLNIGDEQKRTPLHIAAHQNNYAVCKYLIDHGASLELRNIFNKTALQETTDKVVRGFLYDMTNVLRREKAERGLLRSRRSLPLDSRSKPTQSENRLLLGMAPIEISIYRVLSGDEGNRTTASFGGLNTFLMAADTLVKYIWGAFSRRVSSNRIPLTRQEVLESRMDPLAIEAVNASFSFE